MQNPLKPIVEQLESCGYECVAGSLSKNVDFIKLKEMSEAETIVVKHMGKTYQAILLEVK